MECVCRNDSAGFSFFEQFWLEPRLWGDDGGDGGFAIVNCELRIGWGLRNCIPRSVEHRYYHLVEILNPWFKFKFYLVSSIITPSSITRSTSPTLHSQGSTRTRRESETYPPASSSITNLHVPTTYYSPHLSLVPYSIRLTHPHPHPHAQPITPLRP